MPLVSLELPAGPNYLLWNPGQSGATGPCGPLVATRSGAHSGLSRRAKGRVVMKWFSGRSVDTPLI